ncbi:hypothetical protein ACOSQ3_026417 [Xanthoceras sorbifolium]
MPKEWQFKAGQRIPTCVLFTDGGLLFITVSRIGFTCLYFGQQTGSLLPIHLAQILPSPRSTAALLGRPLSHFGPPSTLSSFGGRLNNITTPPHPTSTLGGQPPSHQKGHNVGISRPSPIKQHVLPS